MNSQYQEVFAKLEENPPTVSQEAIRLLCKIADNILKNPLSIKLRTLQKANATISQKILTVKGAQECLKLMGFIEKDTLFEMTTTAPLKNLEDFLKEAECWKKSMTEKSNILVKTKPEVPGTSTKNTCIKAVEEEPITPIKLPPLKMTFSHPFLRNMERISHGTLQYEDKNLQERTKKLIPTSILEESAQKRLRLVQTHIKKNKLEDPELSIQDMLVLELLQWFKQDFFEWVDSPSCEFCGESSTFSHMSTDSKLLLYTDRVELHRCNSCKKFTPFPRYNDLNILLETRRGRCGEWANTFTLCCRAMGWDARYVVDATDHVWTEVYSTTQKRWVHCDPCENICDTPLVYESGWNKKLSYVIAYSAEDVQDVTWRYSSHHKEVLQRRKSCSEAELLEAIIKIRSNLQKNLSASRKKYLLKRTLAELVEFLTERSANSEELQGRSSGAEVWRIARGEIGASPKVSHHVWKINSENIVNNTVIISYSSSLNKYEYVSGSAKIIELVGWEKGAFDYNGISRKEEKDWKMVYLARKEGEEKGVLTWKFDFSSCKRALETVVVEVNQQTYENGLVDIKMCSSDNCLKFVKGQTSLTSKDFVGSQELTLTATLTGGKGDTAWQHAQLFRQSLDSTDFSLSFKFTFQ